MASICISTCLYFPQRQNSGQETKKRRLCSGRLVSAEIGRAALKLVSSNYHAGGVFPLSSSSSHRGFLAPIRPFGEPVICSFGASFSSYIMISGFWVGPDTEDGWGFVEASLHPTC